MSPYPKYLMFKLTFFGLSLLIDDPLLLSLSLRTGLDRHYLMVLVLLSQNTVDAESELTIQTKSLDFL